MKKLKNRVSQKEHFRPDLSDLNMTVRDAKIEVRKKQREISVAIKNSLPKDINKINNVLKYKNWNSKQIKNLDPESIELLNKLNKIDKLIEILVKSKAARITSVHRVLTNKGYRSPGVEKLQPVTNDGYVEIVEWLKKTMNNPNKYNTSPLDRIYLLKTNKTDKFPDVEKPSLSLGDTYSKEKYLRPISIPSIKDRCLQATYYIGYIIYSEYVADSNSYAFRPGRNCGWAAQSIAITLRSKGGPTWLVEIDIAKCFDNINHEFIVKHTPFIPEIILNKWLKQGYILRNYESLGKFETPSGIPQGGIISPTICNTVLDGAETYIRNKLWNLVDNGTINANKAGYAYFRGKKEEQLFKLFRYADDIIISVKSKLMATLCKDLLSEFLVPRGLALSQEKTKITDISGNYAYFEFIGYSFVKRYNVTENKNKWFIDMPENSIKRIKRKLAKICHTKSSIGELFYNFSTTLRSWVGHYATANASRNLQKLNLWVFKIFYYALERKVKLNKELRLKRIKSKSGKSTKYRKLTKKQINHIIHVKYIRKIQYHGGLKMKWYSTKLYKGNRMKTFRLFSPRIFNLISQTLCLTTQNLNYFDKEDIQRITKINLNYKYGVRKLVLRKNFNTFFGDLTCPCCFESFQIVGRYEFHHKTPVEFGGETTVTNLIPLCSPCHKNISIAMQKRKFSDIQEYIQRELIKIPDSYLEQFEE